MKAKQEKIKKPWSAKKLIFSFLLIGVILGLLFVGWIMAVDANWYASREQTEYGTGLAYALQYEWRLYALYFGGAVGGCVLIAGIILLIKAIIKSLATKSLATKQFERPTEDIKLFNKRGIIAEEKVLITGVFGGKSLPILFYILAALSFLVFIIIEIAGWWEGMMFAIGWLAAIVLVTFGLILSNILKKRQLVVTNKRVIARGAFGFRTDIPMEKVTDVSMRWCDGIGCGSPSLKVMFHFCKNKTEVFDTIISESLQRDSKY